MRVFLVHEKLPVVRLSTASVSWLRRGTKLAA